ncbi:MAG: porin [Burkholderiaceae bacterium]|nr:porin [Burkholderiaceae bacterium]
MSLRRSLFFLFSIFAWSSAWATPSVVLYGVIDTGFSYVHVSRNAVGGQTGLSASQFGMNSGVQSGSRWGMKGTEDLGDGWSVSFVLESGFNSDNGQLAQGGRGFGRQATLGGSHTDFGNLVVGRQSTISTNYLSAVDPFGESFGQANIGASFGSVNTVRYDNLIQYESPNLNGFQFGVGYSTNTGVSGLYRSGQVDVFAPRSEYFGTVSNMRALTAAARYTYDEFSIVASFDRAFAAGLVPGPDGPVSNMNDAQPTAWIVGGTYNFKVIEFALAYGRTYDGAFTGNGPGNGLSDTGLDTFTGGAGVLFDKGFDSQSTMVGFTVPVSGNGNELMFSWQTKQPRGRLSGDETFATQSILGVAYTHGLSKRTNLYFWGSYGNNFQMFNSAKSSVVGAGVRHLF